MKNIFLGMLALTFATSLSFANSPDYDRNSDALVDHSKQKTFNPEEKADPSAKQGKKAKKKKDQKKNTEKTEDSSAPENKQ